MRISVYSRPKYVNTMLLIGLGNDRRAEVHAFMDWEDRLDDWELELELNAQLDGSDWVTLERASAETGVSRAALRSWYRTGQIPSRLADGPHGPQRLVPLTLVAARAEASPRLRRSAERRLADQAQLEILRHRVDQLELRLAALERGQPPRPAPHG
jgi:transposase